MALVTPAAKAPRSPQPGAAPQWPPADGSAPARGTPTLRPEEPDCMDAALGRHLELLGAALLARSARPPSAGMETADPDSMLRAELSRVGPDVLLLVNGAAAVDDAKALQEESSQVSSDSGTPPTRPSSKSPPHSLKVPPGPQIPVRGQRRKLSSSILANRMGVTKSGSGEQPVSMTKSAPSTPSVVQRDEIHYMLSTNAESLVNNLSRLGRLVLHPYFEYASVFLVVVNTVAMMVEEQYLGSKVGFTAGFYEHYGSPDYNSRYMPGGEDFFMYLEYGFASMFTLEAVLRMAGRGRAYWKDPSELFDLLIVVCSNVGIVVDKMVSFDNINIQIFRLMRIVRVLRIVRLIGALKALDSLHLMTTALYASRFTLMWSMILLFVMQSFVAIIMTNVLRSQYLCTPGALNEWQTHELLKYFGTYVRSMLSMFELTLANWPPICRFLTDELHEAWMVFAIVYKLTFGFAVVGVINAVFVQETFSVASTDDGVMVRKKSRAADLHARKMEKLFNKADSSGKGEIGARDLRRVLGEKSIQTWLESMDLDASDADLLFALLKGKKNTLSKEQLIQGVAKLKGPARSIDVQMILRALKEQQVDMTGSPRAARHDPWSFLSSNRMAKSHSSSLFA